jgi:hypothetical protein
MKVFEILRSDIPALTEEQIVSRLKTFDWKYEFSEDARRVMKGERELEVLENVVYRMWKTNPDRAIQIWNEHSPGSAGSTAIPSFIFRLQAQET